MTPQGNDWTAQWTWEQRDEAQAQGEAYWKSCLWAPDGSALLGSDSTNSVSVLRLSGDETLDRTTSLQLKLSECVYDLVWYPLMTSTGILNAVWLRIAL